MPSNTAKVYPVKSSTSSSSSGLSTTDAVLLTGVIVATNNNHKHNQSSQNENVTVTEPTGKVYSSEALPLPAKKPVAVVPPTQTADTQITPERRPKTNSNNSDMWWTILWLTLMGIVIGGLCYYVHMNKKDKLKGKS